MQERVLTAREAFDDCLSFFKDTLQPAIQASPGKFEGDIMPGSEFEVTLKVTHGALTALVKRYGAAEFTFHSERNLISTAPHGTFLDPLRDLYVHLTLDFTPYGTGIGGSTNDNGGGMTQSKSEEAPNDGEITATGPTPGPTGPSAPTIGSSETPTPAEA